MKDIKTYIVCTKCQATLYLGCPELYYGDSYYMRWEPCEEELPEKPPSACPKCQGSTIQEGRHATQKS